LNLKLEIANTISNTNYTTPVAAVSLGSPLRPT
jgi:hypothetical protein